MRTFGLSVSRLRRYNLHRCCIYYKITLNQKGKMKTANTLKVTDILYMNITYNTHTHAIRAFNQVHSNTLLYYGLNSTAFQINQTDENRVKSRLSLVKKV